MSSYAAKIHICTAFWKQNGSIGIKNGMRPFILIPGIIIVGQNCCDAGRAAQFPPPIGMSVPKDGNPIIEISPALSYYLLTLITESVILTSNVIILKRVAGVPDVMSENYKKVVHPGWVLKKEFIERLGISQYLVAKSTGVSPRRINEIVHEKRGITADTALRLSKFFGTKENYWIELQTKYDLEKTKLEINKKILKEIEPYERGNGKK